MAATRAEGRRSPRDPDQIKLFAAGGHQRKPEQNRSKRARLGALAALALLLAVAGSALAAAGEAATAAQLSAAPAASVRGEILLFGLLLIIFVSVTGRRTPRWLFLLSLLLPLAAVVLLGRGLWAAWPVPSRDVSLLRAVAAAVAALTVIREVFAPRRFRADHRTVLATLSLSAAAAVATFFNLFNPQFHDHKTGRPSAVHCFDLRIYYPTVKYYEELRFDGLYLASVAAYVDDEPTVTLSSLAGVGLRDLHTYEKKKVAAVRPEIEAVKQRFSPERWEAFKRDMRYFRLTMGTGDYLESMKDHGANATPMWLAVARLLFRDTEASDATLLWGALLDPLLLLIMFVAIGYTFGARAMLIAAVVFGANDFYMYGSNWVGATLRHDWLVYLGLGICSLRRKRWVLAGIWLALAAVMRAFPAIVLAGLAVPALWWLWDYRRSHAGQLPSLALIRRRQRPLLRVALGAAGCAALTLLLTAAVMPSDIWGPWWHKVVLLTQTSHVNHVSLRSLIYASSLLKEHPAAERLVLIVVAGLCTLLVVGVGRGKRLEQAAILALMLVPVVFYPANYYIHFVFLVPLLVTSRRDLSRARQGRRAKRKQQLHRRQQTQTAREVSAKIWLCLLGICVAQYWTVDLSQGWHFLWASGILLFGLAFVLVTLIEEARRARQPASST